jgi:hypothetical protein
LQKYITKILEIQRMLYFLLKFSENWLKKILFSLKNEKGTNNFISKKVSKSGNPAVKGNFLASYNTF